MLEIFEYVKDKVYPRGGDYIFSKASEFLERVNQLLPKIEGIWTISLSRITFEEFSLIQKDYKDKDYILVKMYLKKSTIHQVSENYPKLRIGEMSNWEKYLHIIASNKKILDNKAARELYRRISGNLSKLDEALSRLNVLAVDIITVKEIRKEILDVPEFYYPRDLILSTLLRGNKVLPRKGHRLSKYHYSNPYLILDSVLDDLNEEIVFYAIRKFIRLLRENKMLQLRGMQAEHTEITSLLSIYEIMRVYVIFESSKPNQIYAIIESLLGGNLNVHTFKETFLTNRV